MRIVRLTKNRPSIEPNGIDMIREHNRFDLELYDFARKLFEENLRRNADVISEGLATLNSRREPGCLKEVLALGLGCRSIFVKQGGLGVMMLDFYQRTVLSCADALHPLHRKLKTGQLGVKDLIRMMPHRQNLQCRFIPGIGTGPICDEQPIPLPCGPLLLAPQAVRAHG